MKKLFSLFLVIVMALSCSLMLVACKPDKPDDGGDGGQEMTRAELATTYKEIAQSAWQTIGYENVVSPSLMSAEIPDKKVETTDEHRIANIKGNAKSAIGVIYMLGFLYENDAFVLTDGVAKFNATVSLSGTMNYTFTLTSSLDVENDKVYLESFSEVSEYQGSQMYCYAEIDYDFDAKEVKAFNFISNRAGASVDMALTTDGRYMWYMATDSTDTFNVAVEAQKTALISRAESIELLTENFGTECQVYFNILQESIGGAV